MKNKRKPGGLLFAIKIALGGALGFEIFAYLGLSYIQAGSAVIYALIISGVLNLLTMFSYSELSAVLPEEGAEYTYAKAAFGGFAGFTAGCIRWLSSVIGGALAAQIFTEQLDNFFILSTNGEMSLCTFLAVRFPLLEVVSPQILMLIVATILIATLTILSIKATKNFDTLIICLIVGVFLVFIVMGSLRMSGGTLGEVDPQPELSHMPSFLLATAFMLQPFLGMRCIAASVLRIKKPEKNVPKAIVLSTVLLMLLYFGAAYVSASALQTSNLTFSAENSSLLLPNVGNMTIPAVDGIPIGGLVMTVVGMVVCVSGVSASLVVQGSILCGMSKGKYLPKVLSSTHGNFDTHHVAIITSMLFMIMFAVLGAILEISFLAYGTALLNILVFALVNLSVIGLRRSKPNLARPFKSPLYPLAPIAGIIASLGLLASTAVKILQENGAGVDVSFVLIAFGVLLGLVFLSYYLRMVGGERLRVALGGISLGFGAMGVVSCYMVVSYPDWPFTNIISRSWAFLALVLITIICVVGGILNICSSSEKCLSSRTVAGGREDSLIRDTVDEEMSRVHGIAKKTGRRLSGLVIIVGILLSLLSLWSLITYTFFFNHFGTAVLGLASAANILCGLLLLEK